MCLRARARISVLRVQSCVTCVCFSHFYCPFKWSAFSKGVALRQAAGDHRHHRRQPSSKKHRPRDTQPITDGSTQTNQLQMDVSVVLFALEPGRFHSNPRVEGGHSFLSTHTSALAVSAQEA